MGRFSAIAQVVAAGLQDSSAREQLVRELMDVRHNPTGVDLQSCHDGGAVQLLFDAADRRGLQGGSSLCATISKFSGLTLYMDRDRLAHWSSTVVPIVTAIEDADKTLPPRLVGYRSPSRTMVFANDSSYAGPVLVVLAYAHVRRVADHGAESLHTETRNYTAKTPDAQERKQ